jgi:hypothetical protein
MLHSQDTGFKFRDIGIALCSFKSDNELIAGFPGVNNIIDNESGGVVVGRGFGLVFFNQGCTELTA